MAGAPGKVTFPASAIRALPATPAAASAMMTAHRVDDALSEVAHALERVTALRAARDRGQRRYQAIHLDNHMSHALNNVHELIANLRAHYPAEAAELEALKQTIGLAKAVGTAAKAATTAHLTETLAHELAHAKRHAVLLLHPGKAWEFNLEHARRHVDGAHEHVVKLGQHLIDNYPAEGRWLKRLQQSSGGELAMAAPSAWPGGRMYARSLLTMPRPAPGVISAPGAGSFVYGKLRQEPSQTVSPSPPLPSKVPLPSPAELRSFGGQLARMKDDDQNHHLAGAVMHLESAAEKIENNPVSALASLRSAQSAIQAEWRERVERNQPRIAYVFSDNAPPAERAAQQAAWAKAQASIAQMQGAASKVASFIDRVRRNYFGRAGMTDHTAGGGLAGFPTARLSAAELVRLAQVKAYT